MDFKSKKIEIRLPENSLYFIIINRPKTINIVKSDISKPKFQLICYKCFKKLYKLFLLQNLLISSNKTYTLQLAKSCIKFADETKNSTKVNKLQFTKLFFLDFDIFNRVT